MIGSDYNTFENVLAHYNTIGKCSLTKKETQKTMELWSKYGRDF